MSDYKVILWDLETSHNIVASFGLYDQNIMYQHILQERYIICASWKELGKSRVYSVSAMDNEKAFKANPNDDYHIVKTLHKVLSNADAIVAHYGDKFDIKYLNGRIIKHGLAPLPPIIQMDTYKMAKAKFLFNCNKLDYIGQYLNLGEKIHTTTGLWLKCLKGDPRAIKNMIRYNRQDVRLLERVYNKLAPFVPSKLNRNIDNEKVGCSHCGSYLLQKRGYRLTVANRYLRYQCQVCGHWGQYLGSDKQAKAQAS